MATSSQQEENGHRHQPRSLGITERVTPLQSPWTGELKMRFSDFQVNEIGENGKVLHLHTIGLGEQVDNIASESSEKKPDQRKDLQPSENDLNQSSRKLRPTLEITAEDKDRLTKLTSEKFTHDLINMFQSELPESGEEKEATAPATDDREKRGQIHQEIRRIFQSRIDTSTDDLGVIKAKLLPPKSKSKKRGGRNRGPRPERAQGEYLHFTLYKDNRDTLDAVNQIARLLRIKPQQINYAGTKDRRASTTQRCSVRNQMDRGLAGINGKLWGIVTGDYVHENSPLHLGQLSGNEFTIVVKNCQILNRGTTDAQAGHSLETLQRNVQSAMDHMATNGWINYFGHQRFGTHSIGTDEVGKLILSEQFETAVNSILAYDPVIVARAEKGEAPANPAEKDVFARHHACMLFLTNQDDGKALDMMPRRFSAEVSVLRHLTRQGKHSRKDFIGSLCHITRGLRTMYLHAYQSRVWNHAASHRWKLYGPKVVEGDLVTTETEPTPLVEGQDEDGYDIINPIGDDDDSSVLQARALTEAEANSGHFTIQDLVLPSPGYEVIYPTNEIGQFYKDFMGMEENGKLDPLQMKRKHREFSLPGRYRKLMSRFMAVPSVEIKTYRHDEEQMHPTDLDVLKASRSENKRSADGDDNNMAEQPAGKRVKIDGEASVVSENVPTENYIEAGLADGQKIAAVLKFQLASSAYATVVLKELMGDPLEQKET